MEPGDVKAVVIATLKAIASVACPLLSIPASALASIKQSKLERLVDKLKLWIDENALDRQYIQNEEFVDFIEQVLNAQLRNRSEEKLRLFAAMLVDGAGAERDQLAGIGRREQFLRLISDFTAEEIEFLRWYESRGRSIRVTQHFRDWIYGQGEAKAIAYDGLIMKGLIYQVEVQDNRSISYSVLGRELTNYVKHLDTRMEAWDSDGTIGGK